MSKIFAVHTLYIHFCYHMFFIYKNVTKIECHFLIYTKNVSHFSLLRYQIMVFTILFRSCRTAETWLHLLCLPVPVFWSGVHTNIPDTSYIQLYIDAAGVDVLCDWSHHGCDAGWLCPPAS